MRLFLIITVLLVANTIKSQISIQGQLNSIGEIEYPPISTLDSNLAFFCILEQDATIDIEKWNSYLIESLTLDSLETNKIPPGTYKLIAQFIIDKDGKISSVKVLNDPGYGLGNYVSQVLCANKIIWTPAQRNGRKVKNYRTLPFTFIIDEEEYCEELPKGSML